MPFTPRCVRRSDERAGGAKRRSDVASAPMGKRDRAAAAAEAVPLTAAQRVARKQGRSLAAAAESVGVLSPEKPDQLPRLPLSKGAKVEGVPRCCVRLCCFVIRDASSAPSRV